MEPKESIDKAYTTHDDTLERDENKEDADTAYNSPFDSTEYLRVVGPSSASHSADQTCSVTNNKEDLDKTTEDIFQETVSSTEEEPTTGEEHSESSAPEEHDSAREVLVDSFANAQEDEQHIRGISSLLFKNAIQFNSHR